MIHSIIPMEIIFGQNENSGLARYTEMEYLGEKVQFLVLENNRFKINRILATSPRSYLNPRLQPGNIVDASTPGLKIL